MTDKNTLCGCMDCKQAIDRAFTIAEEMSKGNLCAVAQMGVAVILTNILVDATDRTETPEEKLLRIMFSTRSSGEELAHSIAEIVGNVYVAQPDENAVRLDKIIALHKLAKLEADAALKTN